MTELNQEPKPEQSSWWDFSSALIFFFALMTAATRLVATGWVRNLDLVQTVTLLGVIAGLALGKSIFKPWIVTLFAAVYGIFIIPWQLGSTLGIGIEWRERLIIMVDRIREIILDIILRENVTDNLFFLLLMALVFWVLAIFCCYQLVRHGDIWRAILPGGITLFIIQNYDPVVTRRTWYLAIYILLALILMARMHFIHQRRKWKLNRTYVPPDAGFDIVRFALLASVVIVIMAWNSPALANSISPISNLYHMVEKPWLDAKEQLGFLFASLRATIGMVSDYYSDEQPLGLGNVNADTPVMQVTAPRLEYPSFRYYWRARVYDTYENSRWQTSVQEQIPFLPGDGDISLADNDKRTEVDIDYVTQRPIITLFSPSQPVWFSRSGNIFGARNSDGSLDLINIEASPFLKPGESYKTKSFVSTFTEKELREAGVDYPEWVTSRYLQVPDEITPRTRLLAGLLAEGRDNPYDIATSITQWLRDNISYVEVMDPPPAGKDPIEWFLFDYKKGFCNYYSTSMVMMLRALGIPARWAVGYAQGQAMNPDAPELPESLRGQVPDIYFEPNRKFQVRQLDAHSWPEVFFPGIGWVEFEPTVSQLAIFRPSGEDINSEIGSLGSGAPDRSLEFPQLDDVENLLPPEQTPVKAPRPAAFLIAGIIFFVSGIVLGSFALFFRRNPGKFQSYMNQVSETIKTPAPVKLENTIERLGFQPPAFLRELAYRSRLPLVAQYFIEVNRALSRLGIKLESSATPSERVLNLIENLPVVKPAASILLTQYHRQIYSADQPDEVAANKAAQSIRQLSLQNWWENLKYRLLHPFDRGVLITRGSP